MRYDVKLRVLYRYENPASASRHLARLQPAEIPGIQRVAARALDVSPEPDERMLRRDFFGNEVAEIAFQEPHSEIAFELRSRVEVFEEVRGLDVSPRLKSLPDEIFSYRRLDARSPHHFTGPSVRSPIDPLVTAYAREVSQAEASTMAVVEAVGSAIHRDVAFDATATTVDTSMIEAFENGRGVCQDFSHIMISALRGIGIPAGYVSGFLRTDPPEGEARLEGADAMHAWVMAWCGHEVGWVEYDPTNAVFAGSGHIVVAHGRDYGDVSPVRGTMRITGAHSTSHEVDVVPVG